MSNSAPSSAAHTVRMSADARQFLESRIEDAGQQDVMLPAIQMCVKMSGHLVTIRAWEGRLVFAAKNSAENEYTLSAQLVLNQMLGREDIVQLIKSMEDASICLSFECITSFNGDHGYPERSAIDVMLCTAIHTLTELGPSDPWTYASVFTFCRSHGLPCSQCLYAFDEASAMSAFDAYRGMCHQFGHHTAQLISMFDTFSAHHLCVALESFSHAYVSDVVEGFVVCSTMLSREEIQILLVSEKEGPVPMDIERLLRDNLRGTVNDVSGCLLKHEHALSLWNRTCKEGGGFPVVPLHRVGKWINLRQHLGGKNNNPSPMGGDKVKPQSKSKPQSPNTSSGMAMLKDLLDPSDTSGGVVVAASKDSRTQFVLSVLKTCIDLGIKVNVSFYSETAKEEEEESGNNELLHLAILHVVYDAHHFKFQSHAESVEWSIPLALYRGFVIRLMKATNTKAENGNRIIIAEVFANFYPKFDNAKQQDSTRLISDLWENRRSGEIRKFKFSYYMYATMLCRALLEIGKVGSSPGAMGIEQWELKCKTTLSKWGMKLKDQIPFLLRLLSWHVYVKKNFNKNPPMRSSTYLTHFCRFLAEEASWRQMVLQQRTRIRHVSRAIYVVAPEHHFTLNESGTKNDDDTTTTTVSPVSPPPSSKSVAYYADSLADKLGVECVNLAGREGYTRKDNAMKHKNDEKRKKKQRQNNNHVNEYIDERYIDKIVFIGRIGGPTKRMSGAKTVSCCLPKCSSIPILPKNGKVSDETVAIVDFNGISALKEGDIKSEICRWVQMFKECANEVWDMNEHPPGSVSDRLLEMESRVVQPILIFPCGIPGSGKSAFGRFLSKYGVTLVCSDDKSAPKKNKRTYDSLIENRLRPFTVGQCSQRALSSKLAAITGEGGGGAVEQQQKLSDIQHSEAECHNKDGSATNATITTGQPTLSAVYRDKNCSSNQYDEIIRSVGYNTRVVAVVFGTSISGEVGENMDGMKFPPMTDWEIAVCMRRTLVRQGHEGGLDATLNIALRVVLGFSIRYSGSFRTKGQYMEHLKLLCGENNVLSFPICTTAQFRQNIPNVIQRLLSEGRKCKSSIKLSDDWERRLRDALRDHDDEIKSMDAEPSSHFFRTAITDTVSALFYIANEGNASSSMVFDLQDDAHDSASLFEPIVEHDDVGACLSDVLRNVKMSENISTKCNGGRSLKSSGGSQHLYQVTLNQEEVIPSILLAAPELSGWLEKQSLPLPTKEDNVTYHVTLAFFKRKDKCASVECADALDQLVGTSVQVHVNSCACDGQAAALIVCGMDPSNIRSSNRAAHVTLRTAKNVPPRHSNDMLESGNYNELQFGRSVSLSGIVTTEG